MKAKFSSECIYSDSSSQSNKRIDGRETLSLASSLYGVLHPFADLSVDFSNAPIGCVGCGAYLNPYANIDMEDGAAGAGGGAWTCPICRTSNPRFFPDIINAVADAAQRRLMLEQSFGELCHTAVDYLQPSSETMMGATTSSSPIIIFLVPLDYDAGVAVVGLILDCIASCSQDCRIAIIAYSQCLHLLRLSDLTVSTSPILTCDVIQGNSTSDTHHCLATDLQKGSYLMSKDSLLQPHHQASIIQGIATMVGREGDDRGICSATSMINVLIAFQHHLRCAAVHAISFNTRSYPLPRSSMISPSSSSMNHHHLEAYHQLGATAASNGVYLDIMCAGERGIHYDKLVKLCAGSGGSVLCHAAAFHHPVMRQSLQRMLSYHHHASYQHVDAMNHCASVEIRCSAVIKAVKMQWGGARKVDKCTGYRDTTHQPSSSISSSSINNNTSSQSHLIPLTLDELACTSAMLCHHRRHHDDSIIFQLIPQPHPPRRVQGKEDKTTSIDDACMYNYIQCIARYQDSCGRKVTRTLTHRFRRVDDVKLYLSLDNAINMQLVGVACASIIIRDYHDHICRRYDGAYANTSAAMMKRAAMRRHGSKDDDEVVDMMHHRIDSIASSWRYMLQRCRANPWDSRYKPLFRILYHLRYGSMLDDNAAAHPQESFLLRSQFLSCAYEERAAYLAPRLQLLVLDLDSPAITHLQSEVTSFITAMHLDATRISIDDLQGKLDACLHETDSDSMALLPGCIAVVDCGDLIVIRAGAGLKSDQLYHGRCFGDIMDVVYELVTWRASQRRVVPAVYCLRSGMPVPADRLIMSRLSPSHEDPWEAQLISTADLLCLTEDRRRDMKESLPYTDQPSFHRYITRISAGVPVTASESPRNRDGYPKLFAPVPSAAMDRQPVSSIAINRDVEELI